MPYRWSDDTAPATRALTLWPHQSMTGRGFAWFIGGTVAMLTLPLLAVLGSPILWVLLVFFAAALTAVWSAIMKNRRDRMMEERLTLAPAEVHLVHQPARGGVKEWTANPHWVRVNLHKDGPVENYLTLSGGPREVEIGSFLTADERAELFEDLTRAFDAAR